MNSDRGQVEFMISHEDLYFFIHLLETKKAKMLLKMVFGIKLELKQWVILQELGLMEFNVLI